MRTAGLNDSQKVAAIGTLIAAAAFIVVSAFLTWYTFETQGGFPVQGQSGIDNGLGVWVLVLGAYTIVNTVVLAVATSERSTKIAVRALWTDVILVGIALVLGIVSISSGNWAVVGTSIPLTASAGPGIYLLAVGMVALLIATIRLTLFLRQHSWSWAASTR